MSQSTRTVEDNTVKTLFGRHSEALVVYIDPDQDCVGEYNIRVFSKHHRGGRLATYLGSVLERLYAEISDQSAAANC